VKMVVEKAGIDKNRILCVGISTRERQQSYGQENRQASLQCNCLAMQQSKRYL